MYMYIYIVPETNYRQYCNEQLSVLLNVYLIYRSVKTWNDTCDSISQIINQLLLFNRWHSSARPYVLPGNIGLPTEKA